MNRPAALQNIDQKDIDQTNALLGQLGALGGRIRSGRASRQELATWEALRETALGAGAMLYHQQTLIPRQAAADLIRAALIVALDQARLREDA